MNDENKKPRESHPVMCSIAMKCLPVKISGIHTNKNAGTKNGFSEQCQYAEALRKGAVVKARTIGGLEAVLYELAKRKIPISSAEVGPIKKSDLRRIQATDKPEHRFLIGLSVEGNDRFKAN